MVRKPETASAQTFSILDERLRTEGVENPGRVIHSAPLGTAESPTTTVLNLGARNYTKSDCPCFTEVHLRHT